MGINQYRFIIKFNTVNVTSSAGRILHETELLSRHYQIELGNEKSRKNNILQLKTDPTEKRNVAQIRIIIIYNNRSPFTSTLLP